MITHMSQQRRMRFYARAGSETPYVATEADGALYLIRTRDQNVGRSLFVNQARGEMHVLARVVALLTAALGEDAVRGRTFVDVGANIGTTTLPAVLRHGFAQAIAFEPEPHNLLDLRLNALLNGVEDRVRAVGTALSDATGASNLVVDLEQGGKHWIAVDSKRLELANRRSAD